MYWKVHLPTEVIERRRTTALRDVPQSLPVDRYRLEIFGQLLNLRRERLLAFRLPVQLQRMIIIRRFQLPHSLRLLVQVPVVHHVDIGHRAVLLQLVLLLLRRT